MIDGPQMELRSFLCYIKNDKLYENFYQLRTHLWRLKNEIKLIGNSILYIKSYFSNVFNVLGIKKTYSKYFILNMSSAG